MSEQTIGGEKHNVFVVVVVFWWKIIKSRHPNDWKKRTLDLMFDVWNDFCFQWGGGEKQNKKKQTDWWWLQCCVELTFVVVVLVVVNDYVDHRLWKWRKKNKQERERNLEKNQKKRTGTIWNWIKTNEMLNDSWMNIFQCFF